MSAYQEDRSQGPGANTAKEHGEAPEESSREQQDSLDGEDITLQQG